MKLDSSKIKFSDFDVKRGLKLPSVLTEKLAEDIGIMIGDGHIGKNIRKCRAVDYQVLCSGNAVSDKDYMRNHVKNLKLDLFGLNFSVYVVGKNKSEIRLKINSKGLVDFYTKVVGLPLNKKENISIPPLIWHNKNFIRRPRILRGLSEAKTRR